MLSINLSTNQSISPPTYKHCAAYNKKSANNNKLLQYWQQKAHRCWHLANKVANINRTQDIPYTLQWVRGCPHPTLSLLWGIRAPAKWHLDRFSRFGRAELTVVTADPAASFCSSRPHLCTACVRCYLIMTTICYSKASTTKRLRKLTL